MSKSRPSFCSLSLMLLSVWVVVSSAQTTAVLNGTVSDGSGAVVPGVSVTVTNAETGIQREAVTDSTGSYDIRLLPPGTYNIAVKKDGFRQLTRESVRLEVNQVARIDFTMQLGAVTEAVEVSASAPMLESSNSSVGQVIETKAVSDLPLNGRNFAQLAILSPGAIGVGYGPGGTNGASGNPVKTGAPINVIPASQLSPIAFPSARLQSTNQQKK